MYPKKVQHCNLQKGWMDKMSNRNNIEIIRKSFGKQASNFDSTSYHLSKSEYQDYMIEKVNPHKNDKILEVAAGTCICGRAFARHSAYVTCLDATSEMLEIGKKEAGAEHLDNMMFVKGVAEELPFLDDSFDIVISRLAFHHFVNPESIFSEMKRVLKPYGKLVIMDMTMQNEDLRIHVDDIERMRDFSHVKNLTIKEMSDLYANQNMELSFQEQIEVPVDLEKWMELTYTPESKRDEIRRLINSELEGTEKTGFYPYSEDGRIKFNHHWVLNIGEK